MNAKVDAYVNNATKWQEEVRKLREIVLDFDLDEELKWGVPCYSLEGANIVLIHVFKEYCALLFFKGALMKDPDGILIQQTENTQAARQVRFTSADEIVLLESVLKAYIDQAIAVERAGLKVEFKPTEEFSMPEEFQARLAGSADLKVAFEALTPGRQRGYLLHFSSAKQAKTRLARVEKWVPQILAGKGLDD